MARAPETGIRRDAAGLGGGSAVTRFLTVLAIASLPARWLAAQLPQGDTAFAAGRYAQARAAYERTLATDSLNVRALYRLAILDSWDGKLAHSLQRFATLR